KPKADAATYQWSGMGSVMRYSVQLSRGNTHYTVFSESVRSPDGESMTGVEVAQGDKLLATVQCNLDTVINHLEGVDLPPLVE
ncbi:MAG: hypothetical protein ACRCYV_02025, partial [Aeromonas sp.]